MSNIFHYPVKAIAILLYVLLYCITLPAQMSSAAVPVENGISQVLATYRKKVLNNIQYQLHLHIPENKQQPIPATESISFILK